MPSLPTPASVSPSPTPDLRNAQCMCVCGGVNIKEAAFLWGGPPGGCLERLWTCLASTLVLETLGHLWLTQLFSSLPRSVEVLGWMAHCGCLEEPFFCVSGMFSTLAPVFVFSCLLAAPWVSEENKSVGNLLFPVVNVFHACCVPLCSSSGQLLSCWVLLLSTAGGSYL